MYNYKYLKDMRIKLFSFLGFLLFLNLVSASHLPISQARDLAMKAYVFKTDNPIKSIDDVKIISEYTKTSESGDLYYIFNLQPTGFIIISAEENYNPILAFSDESTINFEANEINGPLWATLGKHELRIEYSKLNGAQLPHIKKEWAALKSGNFNEFATRDPEGMVIPPLTTTKWNQGKYYNSFTPKTNEAGNVDGGTYCGCAPIAMAQLIKYHNYPPHGNGSKEYDDPQYGPQSVDFCAAEYDWTNMPDSLTDYNNDLAEFIYHVGVSTETHYSTVYTETFNSTVRDALVFNFNFDEAASWFIDDPEDSDFARVAIADLNLGRPVMITGVANTGGGHSWVVDGYGYFLDPGPTQPDEYFHFNWGWGGYNNGWFLDTDASWSPIPFEYGTTFINFYYQRIVIHNVFPSSAQCPSPTSLRQSGQYLYTTVPDGEEITFRYRKVGTSAWTESNVVTGYYYRVSDLEEATQYEFQVKRKCCPSNWSDYSSSHYFTTEGAQGSACDNALSSKLTTSSVAQTSAYIYTSRPYGNVNNQFRYRFVGGTLWSYTDISSNYFRRLTDLQEGTEYEFQVRHECESGTYTDFSDLSTFATQGITGCDQIFDVDLYTSSTTDDRTYVYTTQPYGKVDNKFRYRPIGTTDWIESSVENTYYRSLTGLMSGTEYEFQVSHFCQGWAWTDWSFSSSFTTTGGTSGDCDPVNGDRLYFNSVSNSNAYIYTPQPFGLVANQFRYRPQGGGGSWSYSSISTQYYRYLRNLSSNTEYEFQVKHECAVGLWSEWSESKTFTTSFRSPGVVQRVLLPPSTDAGVSESVASIFPNPALDIVNIQMEQESSDDKLITIFNIAGERVSEVQLQKGEIEKRIDISQLDPGVYFVKYATGINVTSEKLIKL